MLIIAAVDGINSIRAAIPDTWGLEGGSAKWKYY